MATLGLDIGGTRVKAALLGNELRTGKSSKYRRPDTETLLAALREALPTGDFDRVSLCAPGLASADGSCIETSVNVPGICNVPLRDIVRQVTGRDLQPTLATDAHATAVDLAHLHDLVGRTLLLAIGTGVGACVLDREAGALGSPLRVDGNSPGHFGQLDVRLTEDPPIGPDGGGGGLEAYCGSRALRGKRPDNLDARSDAVRALVRAIRLGHALYRPHHVALAGGIGVRLAHLAEEIRRDVNDRLTSIARPDWQLHFGTSDFHAARGAARLAGE